MKKPSLKRHIEIVHEGKKPSEKCPSCEKLFREKTHLTRHIRDVHEKKKPFACDLCEWSFAQSGQLKTHKRGKHKLDI